jgi:hypothetical protein
MLFRPNFYLLGAVGTVLVVSLGWLIWRSWHQEGTNADEQRALLGVALNVMLGPAAVFAVAYLIRPTLGILAAFTLVASAVSLILLPRIHGTTLGDEGLYDRVRNLSFYYSYLFLLLSQFPKIHVTLAWYLADPGRAQLALLGALMIPGVILLAASRPSQEEWRKWWPIRQWSALFLVLLLSSWMALTFQR